MQVGYKKVNVQKEAYLRWNKKISLFLGSIIAVLSLLMILLFNTSAVHAFIILLALPTISIFAPFYLTWMNVRLTEELNVDIGVFEKEEDYNLGVKTLIKGFIWAFCITVLSVALALLMATYDLMLWASVVRIIWTIFMSIYGTILLILFGVLVTFKLRMLWIDNNPDYLFVDFKK